MSAMPDLRGIEELLPWYAAGTLDPEQAAQVEAALAAHPELRRSLALAEEELRETVGLNEALGAPSTRALEALFAGIDAEPARGAPLGRRLRDLGGQLSEWFSPRTAGWATLTAGLVIAAQLAFHLTPSVQEANRQVAAGGPAGLTPSFSPREPGRFATANKDEAARSGSFLLVAFQGDAKIAAINDALAAVRAVVVDGPRAGGLYRLRIGPASLPEPEIQRIAETLGGNKGVIRLVLRSSE